MEYMNSENKREEFKAIQRYSWHLATVTVEAVLHFEDSRGGEGARYMYNCACMRNCRILALESGRN